MAKGQAGEIGGNIFTNFKMNQQGKVGAVIGKGGLSNQLQAYGTMRADFREKACGCSVVCSCSHPNLLVSI